MLRPRCDTESWLRVSYMTITIMLYTKVDAQCYQLASVDYCEQHLRWRTRRAAAKYTVWKTSLFWRYPNFLTHRHTV